MPEKDPWPDLRKAIEEPSNWQTSFSPGLDPAVIIRRTPGTDQQPLHPLGTQVFRQNVVPLDEILERYGEYRPAPSDRFIIKTISVGAEELDPTENEWHFVRDYFAAGQYEDLSKHEKLSRVPFERMKSGFSITNKGFDLPDAGRFRSQVLEYERLLIDKREGTRKLEIRERVQGSELRIAN